MRAPAGLPLLLGALMAWPAAAEEAVTGAAAVRDPVTVAISGARYRLEGIEPPREGAVCAAQSCLDAAMAELARFVSGRDVTCTATQRVGHGFFLSSCRLENGSDLAQHLLSRGLAELGAEPSAEQRAAAEKAKAARLGVWAGAS